ncbi:orotidine 5'-phosphate decarboxylase / HUMPS family protein [Thermococcus paralvinellae]
MIILALDVYEKDKALKIAEETKDYLWTIKINLLLMSSYGQLLISS